MRMSVKVCLSAVHQLLIVLVGVVLVARIGVGKETLGIKLPSLPVRQSIPDEFVMSSQDCEMLFSYVRSLRIGGTTMEEVIAQTPIPPFSIEPIGDKSPHAPINGWDFCIILESHISSPILRLLSLEFSPNTFTLQRIKTTGCSLFNETDCEISTHSFPWQTVYRFPKERVEIDKGDRPRRKEWMRTLTGGDTRGRPPGGNGIHEVLESCK